MTGLSKKDIYGKAQIFLGLLVFGMMLASPVLADDTEDRVRDLEREVETLGRAVYSGERPTGQGSTASADTEVRIQGLENEIRTLTGKVEEKDYEIRQLKEQLEKLSMDIDTRFGEIQGGGGQMNGGFTNNPIRNGSMNNDGGMQYRDHSMDQQPQDVPQPTAPSNDTGGSGYQWKSGSAAGGSAPKPGQLGTMTQSGADSSLVAAGDTAATLYENAFSLLKGAQYDEAEKEFKSFLRQYPGHALTANAKYWLGETYYVRGQFEKGAQTFAEGYQAAPKGPKAADNLLKMGMSLSGMGKKPEACVALGQIGKEFASAGPVLRRAQQEMTRLGC